METRLSSTNWAALFRLKPVFKAISADAHVAAWEYDAVWLISQANDARVIIACVKSD